VTTIRPLVRKAGHRPCGREKDSFNGIEGGLLGQAVRPISLR